jgi:glycine/D-amino acid oxidase-like deaminating enzyme
MHLLEQGKSVCVLEAHRAGHGGSGRNVGLVNAGLWIPPDDIEAGFGEAVGSQLNRMLGAAPALVFSLVDKYNIDCQLRREGTLHMAHNARARRICAVAKNNGSAVARRSSCSPGRPASKPRARKRLPPPCSTGAPARSTRWPIPPAGQRGQGWVGRCSIIPR